MSDEPRIAIIGGGLAGVGLAFALAERGRGAGVVLLEREASLGAHSSGRNAAILRTAIAAGAARRLALETARWLRCERAHGDLPLLDGAGLVLFEGGAGDPPPVWLPDHRAWEEEVELLDERDRERRAPHFAPRGSRAWWFPRQGRVDVAALLNELARRAREGGVELRTRASVRRVHFGGEPVVELAGEERIACATVVVAAGGWSSRLAPEAGREEILRPTRRHLLVTAPASTVDPRWPVAWDDAARFYARPESGGLLLCACDQAPVDPDRCEVEAEAREAIARKTAAHLPRLAESLVAHCWAGVRTLTPDDSPCVGPDPRVRGLFWHAGLGGHGVSLSIGVARAAAGLLLGERDERAASLAPERFALRP